MVLFIYKHLIGMSLCRNCQIDYWVIPFLTVKGLLYRQGSIIR